MYDQIREDTLYMMLYAAVTTLAMLASCYLLFRWANAIAPDVTSPVRLRRWTAALGTFLDCITFFPLSIIVLLTML